MKRATTILTAALIMLLLNALAPPAQAADPAPDYVAKRFTTNKEKVVQGATFTRRLVIKNTGDAGGDWPVSATINQIDGITQPNVVRWKAPAFDHCALYFTPSGTVSYVRCYGAYLEPGEKAVVKVVYRATRWVGFIYGGGGYVTASAMELESDTTNNYLYGPSVGTTTTVVAP